MIALSANCDGLPISVSITRKGHTPHVRSDDSIRILHKQCATGLCSDILTENEWICMSV